MKYKRPMDIENKSMQIIKSEIGEHNFNRDELIILKRVIHTSADFEYKENLFFSKDATVKIDSLLEKGTTIITDTTMAFSGINKRALKKLGINLLCLISDDEVIAKSKENQTTRSWEAAKKAINEIKGKKIFVVGNAPTALYSIIDEYNKGENIDFIIAVPVGFVNVVESKELVQESGVDCIVSLGRKGGSNVAAAIINAVLYNKVDRMSLEY